MVITEMVWGTALTSVNMYYNIKGRLQPWTNWEDVHYNFSRIDAYPEVTIPLEFRSFLMLIWWAMPVSSLIFFLFFGFGEEAKREYMKAWEWCRTIVYRGNLSEKNGMISSGILGSLLVKSQTLINWTHLTLPS